MKITKLEHSGIIIEKDGKNIVFDPVEYKKQIPKIENVVAVVITHRHSDHLQMDVLKKILANSPNAKIFTTNETTQIIENAVGVSAGMSLEVEGFKLSFFGSDHAAIVPGQIPCTNIGVVVDDFIVNPGDSFDLPVAPAGILFVPISGPWLKIYESMEYVEKARPKIVVPFHDAFLSEFGESTSINWLKRACENVGAECKTIRPNESFEI